MSKFSGIRDNALKYLLYPSIVGGVLGSGYDYFDQKHDFEEDSPLLSIDRIGHGAFTGLGAGAAALAGRKAGRGAFGSLVNATAGGAGGYFLYSPIQSLVNKLFNAAAAQEVDKRQNEYISNYMKTYGK